MTLKRLLLFLTIYCCCHGAAAALAGHQRTPARSAEPPPAKSTGDVEVSTKTVASNSGRVKLYMRRVNYGPWSVTARAGSHGRKYPVPVNGDPDARGSYWPDFYFHPSDRWLVREQKICAGTGLLFLYRGIKPGRFAVFPDGKRFDRIAWHDFDRRNRFTGEKARRYHEWCSFVGWGPDGESMRVELSGRDIHEEYSVVGWRMHFNLRARTFFLTPGDRAWNRKEGIWWINREAGEFAPRR